MSEEDGHRTGEDVDIQSGTGSHDEYESDIDGDIDFDENIHTTLPKTDSEPLPIFNNGIPLFATCKQVIETHTAAPVMPPAPRSISADTVEALLPSNVAFTPEDSTL